MFVEILLKKRASKGKADKYPPCINGKVYHVIKPSFIPFQHIRSKFGLKVNLWATMNVQQFLSFLHILVFGSLFHFKNYKKNRKTLKVTTFEDLSIKEFFFFCFVYFVNVTLGLPKPWEH
jgi:hypothetical protein